MLLLLSLSAAPLLVLPLPDTSAPPGLPPLPAAAAAAAGAAHVAAAQTVAG